MGCVRRGRRVGGGGLAVGWSAWSRSFAVDFGLRRVRGDGMCLTSVKGERQTPTWTVGKGVGRAWEARELILRTEGGLLGSDSENQMLGVFEGDLVEEQEEADEAD